MQEKHLDNDIMIIINDFKRYKEICDSDDLNKLVDDYFNEYVDLPQDTLEKARELILKEEA